MKNVCLLGATGSIGTQTLDLIKEFNKEYKLVAFSYGKNTSKAITIIEEFKPSLVCCSLELDAKSLSIKYPNIKFVYGIDGLNEVATFKTTNPVVINALVGSVGLLPTMKAILDKRDVYLANKETLVIGGKIVTDAAKKKKVRIIPIDSEHSAVAQIIEARSKEDIKRLLITASGGSFRDKTREELINVTKEDALNHPNWKMGAKITIDSSTMMNKGFELIEAHYLFDIPMDKIVPIMHKESIIHSMVEFNDGSIFAQMGSSDMHLPIKYALDGPSHSKSINIKPLDIFSLDSLHFSKVDFKRFPMVSYAIEAINKGGIYPTILNAANEVAVGLFLNDKIKYLEIEEIVCNALNNSAFTYFNNEKLSLELILKVDKFVKDTLTKEYN